MEKITLQPRLELVASLVPQGASVADIGTDHGRIPVFLVQNQLVKSAIAADLNAEPLSRAKALISEFGLEEKISTILSDGLLEITPFSADTIIIAGMGGETIINILSAVSWIKKDIKLILQPQSKQFELRKWLFENEFDIKNEHLVLDNDRIYPIMEVIGGKSEAYNLAEFAVGKKEMHNSEQLFGEYLSKIIDKTEKVILGMRNSSEDAKLAENEKLVKELEKMRRAKVVVKICEIMDFFEKSIPSKMKMDFDNVGLLVGKSTNPVSKVLCALDITNEVIEEAIEIGAELIVSHHPLFFKLKSVTDSTGEGHKIIRMLENGISAICLHTNLDIVDGGVNDVLIEKFGCRVFGSVDTGAAYNGGGMGRFGEISAAIPMSEFLEITKKTLNASGLRFHSSGKPVKRIAVCGGSGGDLIDAVIAHGCDTYITADIKYHQFMQAVEAELNLIDAGHYCTENIIIPIISKKISDYFSQLDVRISTKHKSCINFC